MAQVLLGLAHGLRRFPYAPWSEGAGPRAGLDTLYVNAMLLLLTFGIRSGSSLYFEAALVVALLGFVGTVALAKFLLRGEVIE